MPTILSTKDALDYHERTPAGKIEVTLTKPLNTQEDLALAYSPGVAEPCKLIAKDKKKVFNYTVKGNLVAVITNGTAVLGLGNIGPEAAKPVMEGKVMLLKQFADIDAFDIELDANDPDVFINAVKALEPTFGAINLEDIKAPECFEIEKSLKAQLNIPVMHDDQHGTAIISGAALCNALTLVNKKLENIRLVVSGAGASAIASTKLYLALGVKKENIVMCDSKGVIRQDRKNLTNVKAEFATQRNLHTLADALQGADVLLGLSRKDIVTPAQLQSMASSPIVFALANPDPEIAYPVAIASRQDVIMATGRSDYPNQVNNVLGFPYLFRGALDVRATAINEPMKMAAAKALAHLAKQPVPDVVKKIYDNTTLAFGKNYLIPKPTDPRLITTISMAVAKAAVDSGVAQKKITDWAAYEVDLQKRLPSC